MKFSLTIQRETLILPTCCQMIYMWDANPNPSHNHCQQSQFQSIRNNFDLVTSSVYYIVTQGFRHHRVRFDLYLRVLRGISKRSPLWQSKCIQARWSSTKTSLPLRILFCGSDDLSAVCLKALYQEQQRDPEGIKSIDVLVRPAKPYGRSLKKFREGLSPLVNLACFH